jgi:hypothetical protein
LKWLLLFFDLFSLSLKSKLQELLGAARLYLANILSQEMLSATSVFWCRAEQLSAKPQSSTIKKSSTNFFASEKCSAPGIISGDVNL